MKTLRSFDSLLRDARKNCTSDQLRRYISERHLGHFCRRCWRCACAIALREREQHDHANNNKGEPV